MSKHTPKDADDKNADTFVEEAKPAVDIAARPNDIPIEKPKVAPLGGNSTFARAEARRGRPSGSSAHRQLHVRVAQARRGRPSGSSAHRQLHVR